IVTTLLGKRHWSLCGGSHIALEPASRRYERAQQFLQVNYGDACSHIAGRVWEYQLALMNHSSARVHDIRNIAEPLGSGRNEQGLASLADHPAGIIKVKQGCADAILAHRANTVSQQ